MNRISWFLVVVLFTAVILACGGDDGPTGPAGITVADLAGEWTTTKLEYTNKANSAQKVDGLALGETLSLSIQSNGQYEATIGNENASITVGGTLGIEGDILNFHTIFLGNAQVSLSGNTMTLTFDGARYDFDGSGAAQPAILLIVMQRSS